MGKQEIKVHRKKETGQAKSSSRYTFIIANRFYDQRKFFVRRISVAAKRKVGLFVYKRKKKHCRK